MAKGSGKLCGLAAGFLSAAFLGLPADAQTAAAPSTAVSVLPTQTAPGPDSAAVHEAAQELQARFERFRIRHLPRTMAGSGGRCERVIGRLCIWDGGDPSWTPEPEAQEIVDGRLELVTRLDSLARMRPGNAWILGQRVRYRLEASDFHGAAAVARACGPTERWICKAFEGLALHRRDDVPGAEAAFAEALESAPENVSLQWTDPTPLLDPGLGDWLEDQPDSSAAVETLWLWSDPLFLAPGNDRWTGHLSRWAHALSSEDSRSPHQMRWGDDLTEAVVRYGWTVAWERPWPRAGEMESSSAVSHESPTALRFVPDRDLLPDGPVDGPVDGLDGGEDEESERIWTLDRKGMKTLYLPPYLDSLAQAGAQWARFPSPEGVVVLAAAENRTGSSGPVGLFASPGPGTVTRGRGGRAPGRIWGSVLLGTRDGDEPPTSLVSLEALHRPTRRGQRSRAVIRTRPFLPDLLTLSDVAVLDRGPEPATLDQVAQRMKPGSRVGPVDTLAVAFQVTGLGPRQEPLSFRVWVEKGEQGVLSRLAGWVGIGEDEEPLSVAWTESAPPGARALLRSVQVVLPDLEPGLWDLAVGVQSPGRFEAVRKRRIRVEDH
ncbi:MAG: hypothetical protein HKN73_13590 [Gemmatimonadetes bacterium]|nr:hypothetical protein [Gemmatimonadota bacterium]